MIDPQPADLPGFVAPPPPKTPTEPSAGPRSTVRPTVDQPRTTTPADDSPDARGGDAVAEDVLSRIREQKLSPASTERPAKSRAEVERTAADLAPLVATATTLLGELLNRRRATPATPHVWLFTEADHELITAPLSRIAARRVPSGLLGDGDAGDVVDLVQLGVGAVGYGVTNARVERTAAGPTIPAPEAADAA